MFGSIGGPELILIFVVALLIFGPRRLSEIGRTLGKALGEFRRATYDLRNTLDSEVARVESAEKRERLQQEQAEAPGSAPIAIGVLPPDGAANAGQAGSSGRHDAAQAPAPDSAERRDPTVGDAEERRDIG